jgi:hypothetical protein
MTGWNGSWEAINAVPDKDLTMWDAAWWSRLEAAAPSGIEGVRALPPPERLLQKYETLVKSGRAGCIGYGARRVLGDVERLCSFYERQGFALDSAEDPGSHVLSLGRPLGCIRRALVERYELCPRLHVDILPLSCDKSDLWVVPHIDPHDPAEAPELHELDRASHVFVPPSPLVKLLLKLVLAGKEARNVLSPIFSRCVVPLGMTA